MSIVNPKKPVVNNTLTLFVKQIYVLYESQQRDARVSYFVNDSLYDPSTSASYYQLRSQSYAEHAPVYAMAANAGVVKGIVSFYRVDSNSAFDRFRSRIPIKDINTVHALKKHLVAFLGLKELTRKCGLGDFDIKLFRMAPMRVGKATTSPSPQTTSGSWIYQAYWMAQGAK